jgi:hypothetical protein
MVTCDYTPCELYDWTNSFLVSFSLRSIRIYFQIPHGAYRDSDVQKERSGFCTSEWSFAHAVFRPASRTSTQHELDAKLRD